VSISPGDRLEFVEDRLKFEKSSPRWRIVGKEEIEEMKEGSTEIGRQRSEKRRMQQAAGRLVCTRCTNTERSTARSTVDRCMEAVD